MELECREEEGMADELPLPMSFTVHFDSAKTTVHKFTRRHIRNLSLPISKAYENKIGLAETPENGKTVRKTGNHSEGYFSSDPDEDRDKQKLFEAKTKNVDKKGGTRTNLAQKKRTMSQAAVEGAMKPDVADNRDGVRGDSDEGSEAGTYTIDNDSPEVVSARLRIDTTFGVAATHTNGAATRESTVQMTSSCESNTWINDWATQVVQHNHQNNNHIQPPLKTHQVAVRETKIPSPVQSRTKLLHLASHTANVPTHRRTQSQPYAKGEECSDSSLETECFLAATERVVSAMAARVSLSLDSESDVDTRQQAVRPASQQLRHSDSSASESDHRPAPRYNRAVNLRRSRLEEPKQRMVTASVGKTAVTPNNRSASGSKMSGASNKKIDCAPKPVSAPTFSRTDCGRFSMRASPQPKSPLVPQPKKELGSKKTAGGGRSNSTLSSREVEFQNWKRRKSYDPMKAAAEGKKKETPKKPQATPNATNAMTQSTSNVLPTPTSPVNPVLRSASFHGTRQLAAPSSSEDDEEITLSAEEDWPVLQVPKTSLENTPQGSKASLYRDTSNSSLRARPKLEGVDNLVISAVSGLSGKMKGSSCQLLKKLRYLYEEDSEKWCRLNNEIEQLEASEPGSPQVRSPSRELASTLRNLKRLESMLKVLDGVLFDDEDYQ